MVSKTQTFHVAKIFAVKHRKELFFASLAITVVATIGYKYWNQEPQKIPSDEAVIEKVKQLDCKELVRLFDKGGRPDAKSKNGTPALIVAIANAALFEEDAVKTFDCLIARGANVNVSDLKKQSPLHYAAIQWETKGSYFAKELVKKGASWNALDQNNKMPIHYVQSLAVFDELVALGVKVDTAAVNLRRQLQKTKLMSEILKAKKGA